MVPPEGGMDMILPKAVRAVGAMEKKRIVYLEDYVLQYLTVCAQEEEEQGTRTVLYGKKERDGDTDIYLIYGLYKQKEESASVKAQEGKEERQNHVLPMEKKYRRLGYIHPETGGIMLDGWGPGQTVQGYYVFYDAEEKMKECLGEYYGRKSGKERTYAPDSQSSQESVQDRGKTMKASHASELVALSRAEEKKGGSPFLWVRIAVVGIFIIFCAIAVMTVNSFDKLYDFVQTAVMTEEIMDGEESN